MPADEDSKNSKYDDDDLDHRNQRRRNQLLADAVAHFEKVGMSKELQQFTKRYIELLDDGDGKRAEEEHNLEHTELFQQYMEMVEQELTEFIESRDCTLVEFYSDCRDALEDKYCALFEDHEHKWFVELLLSMSDFQEFHQMMVQRATSSRK